MDSDHNSESMSNHIMRKQMYEQFNMLTLNPYKSGTLKQLVEHHNENQYSSNLWGTEKQIQRLDGKVNQGEIGITLRPWKHVVFNLNQTNLDEGSLVDLREKLRVKK